MYHREISQIPLLYRAFDFTIAQTSDEHILEKAGVIMEMNRPLYGDESANTGYSEHQMAMALDTRFGYTKINQ